MTAGDDEFSADRIRSDMLDVTALPLGEVIRREDSALDHAIRGVLEDLRSPEDIISGWNSFIE